MVLPAIIRVKFLMFNTLQVPGRSGYQIWMGRDLQWKGSSSIWAASLLLGWVVCGFVAGLLVSWFGGWLGWWLVCWLFDWFVGWCAHLVLILGRWGNECLSNHSFIELRLGVQTSTLKKKQPFNQSPNQPNQPTNTTNQPTSQ